MVTFVVVAGGQKHEVTASFARVEPTGALVFYEDGSGGGMPDDIIAALVQWDKMWAIPPP